MTSAINNVPGMPCPECGTRIVVKMEQLLANDSIACSCGLVLHIDQERSQETLRDLRELQRRLAQLQG